jgi:PAS domain S-box-containing protein
MPTSSNPGPDEGERPHAQEVLRAHDALYSLLTEYASDFIRLHELDGRSIYGSRSVDRLFGQTPASIFDFVHPEDLEPGRCWWQQVLAGDAARLRWRVRAANGEWRWMETDGTVVPFNGTPHVLTVCRDITERMRLEDQFRQAQKMEAVGLLAAGVAHDFNNLLTIISGYTEILLTEVHPADAMREMISQIRQAGEHASSLTRQLLAFSRRTMVEPRVLDVNEYVRDTEKMVRRVIGEDVQLTTNLDPALEAVKVDPGQLGQIIMNLAVNARDAMPTGGHLTIETSNVTLNEIAAAATPTPKPGHYVLLAVSDSGMGMTPDVKARLFEPFFTTKALGKGTGLGLATVYSIVQQSAGFIAVHSEPERGTVFQIYFPVAAPTAPPTHSGIDSRTLARGTETILLVEDEDAVRSMIRLVLERAGYSVLATNGGAEALRIAAEHPAPIHLLITDVVMPAMGGRELVERLTNRRPGIKVLYLSGYTDDAIVRHGILQADVAFLQKPFTIAAFTMKVRQVLDDTLPN